MKLSLAQLDVDTLMAAAACEHTGTALSLGSQLGEAKVETGLAMGINAVDSSGTSAVWNAAEGEHRHIPRCLWLLSHTETVLTTVLHCCWMCR